MQGPQNRLEVAQLVGALVFSVVVLAWLTARAAPRPLRVVLSDDVEVCVRHEQGLSCWEGDRVRRMMLRDGREDGAAGPEQAHDGAR